VQEGAVLAVDLSAFDTDGDTLSYTLLQAPQGATLDQAGHLRWTATDQDAQFTVKVTDPSGASATQQFSVQVQLGRLVVTGFESKAWGFTVRFNDVVDPARLNLYGTAAADVVVTGAASGAVKGSVVYDADGKGFAFIRTGAQLAADTYTVTLRGAADGVSNTRRGALDGDANGSAGGNHVRTFQIGAAPALRLRLPDLARGPGQELNVPAGSATGVPLTFTNTSGRLSRVDLHLRVDPRTFDVTEIRREALPNATVTVAAVAGVPGQWDVSIVANAGYKLPTGTLQLLSLVGSVPWTATPGSAGAIVVEQVRIDGVAAPLAADAAVQVVAYLGDMTMDGQYNEADAKIMSALSSRTINGVDALDDLDASIVADVNGDGLVNAQDMLQVALRSKATSTALIPAIPSPPPAVNLSGSFSNFSLGGGSGAASSSSGPLSGASLSITPSLLPSAISQGVPASA
jgi:hypothetical protein